VEAIAFGLLIFVVGSLIVANAWAVVDAKFAAEAAAREAARTYVETGATAAQAEAPARRAADAALASLRRPGTVDVSLVDGGYRRCASVTVRVTTRVPVLRLPFIRVRAGHYDVTGLERRAIDPLRSGLVGEISC
jgi:hypothetical protein